MSATVYKNDWGTWVGHCSEHRETIAGAEHTVRIWAGCHNEDNHRPDLRTEKTKEEQ